MNEFFAVEPICCKNFSDLRLLLDRFGPYAGRYLTEYPTEWDRILTGSIENLGSVEVQRIKTYLRRAHERGALLRNPALDWDETCAWTANAKRLVSAAPPKIDGVVVTSEHASADDITLDNFDEKLPLTADEKIPGTVDEYLRVSRTLLANSSALFVVDPYLNPCKSSIREVLEKMLGKVVRGKRCRRVACFGRADNVIGKGSGSFSWTDVEAAWVALLERIGWPKDRDFEYVLFDDDGSSEKLHARYLLSIKGGIRFEHGFQVQSRGARVDVCPINKTIHEALLMQFVDGVHDWTRKFEFHTPSQRNS